MAMATAAIPTPSTPIAQLRPELDVDSTSVTGIVALIWPYASSTQSTSLLLVEPDFRLRRHQGQVYIQFHGSSAKAVAKAAITSGDRLSLSLGGSCWVKNNQANTAPGKSIEWGIRFGERLYLQVQHQAQEPIILDVDHPPPAPEPPYQPSTPRWSPSYNSHVPASVRKSLFDGNAWESPAFLKRNRFSTPSYGIFTTDEADEFPDNERRKRLRFGRSSSQWKFADRTPSPEKEPEVDKWEVVNSSQPQASEAPPLELPSLGRTEAEVVIEEEQQRIVETIREDQQQVPGVTPPSPPTTSIGSPKREGSNQLLQPALADNDSSYPTPPVNAALKDVQESILEPERDEETESSHGSVSSGPRSGFDADTSVSLRRRSSSEEYSHTRTTDDPDPVPAETQLEYPFLATTSGPPNTTNHLRPQDINEESIKIKESAHRFHFLDEESTTDAKSPRHDEQRTTQLQSNTLPTSDQLESDESNSAPVVGESEVERNSLAKVIDVELEVRVATGKVLSDVPLHRQSPTEVEEIHGDTSSHIANLERDVARFEGLNYAVFGAEPPNEQFGASVIEEAFESQADQARRPAAVKESKVEIIDLESEENVEQSEPLKSEDEMVGESEHSESDDEHVEQSEHLESGGESVEQLAYLETGDGSSDNLDQLSIDIESVEQSSYLGSDNERVEYSGHLRIENESLERSAYVNSENDSVERLEQPGPKTSFGSPLLRPNIDVAKKPIDGSTTSPKPTKSISSATTSPASSQSAVDNVHIINLDSNRGAESVSLPHGSLVSRYSRENLLPIEREDHHAQIMGIETIPKLQPEVDPEKSVQQERLVYPQPEQDFSETEDQKSRPQSPIVDLTMNLQTEITIKQTSPDSLIELPSTVPDTVQEAPTKSQLLTPDTTQQTSFASQPSVASLQSAPDNDTLPTPRLTQGHSAGMNIPEFPAPEEQLSLVRDASLTPRDKSDVKKSPGDGSSALQKPPTLIEKLKAMRRLSSQTPQKMGNANPVSPWFTSRRSSIIVPDSEVESEGDSLSEDDAKKSSMNANAPLETPEKRKPLAKSFIRSPPQRKSASSVASSPGYLPPSQPPPPGFRTSLSYFVPLPTLQSHFSQSVDVLAIALAATDVTRATTGPRDYHQTIYVTDPMSSSTKVPITAAQIFRSSKGCFPIVEKGDAILLREFKVQSFQRQMALLSTGVSAWAVFRQGTDVQVRGPPVEFGAEERGFARGLWRWWDDLSHRTRERLAGSLPTHKDKEVVTNLKSNAVVKREGQQLGSIIKKEAIEGLGVDLPGSQSKTHKGTSKKANFDPDESMESTEPAKRVIRPRGSRGLPEKSESPARAIDRSSGTVFTGGLGEAESE